MRKHFFGYKRTSILAIITILTLIVLGLGGWLGPVLDAGRNNVDLLSGIGSGIKGQLMPSNHLDEEGTISAETLRLRRENAVLRTELNAPEPVETEMIVADVMGRNIHALRRIITVNQGSEDGVENGTEVLSQGYLVGVVEKAYHNSSDVILISDPLFRTTVTIGDANAEGILIGEANGVFVDKVPSISQLKVGDPVFTSGLDGYTHRGFPIGHVAEIEAQQDQVFYSLIVRLPVSLDNLEIVRIVK